MTLFFSQVAMRAVFFMLVIFAVMLHCTQATPTRSRVRRQQQETAEKKDDGMPVLQSGGDPAYDSVKNGAQNDDGTPKIYWKRVVHFVWKSYRYLNTAFDTLKRWFNGAVYDKDNNPITTYQQFKQFSGIMYDRAKNKIFEKTGNVLEWFKEKKTLVPLQGHKTHVHDENKSGDLPAKDQSYTQPPYYAKDSGTTIIIKVTSLAFAVTLVNIVSVLLF